MVAAHGFPGDLWLCDVSAGTVELLALLGADDLYTAWEPTGQRIALLSAEGIHMVDLGAGTLRQLTPTAGYGAIDWARLASGQ